MTGQEVLKVFEDIKHGISESYKGILYSFNELVEFDLTIKDEVRHFKANMIYIDKMENKLVFTDFKGENMYCSMGLTFVYKLEDVKEIKRWKK